jgi:hypothetical protein
MEKIRIGDKHPGSASLGLKVVGNEKEGGPGKWKMIDIYLGLW